MKELMRIERAYADGWLTDYCLTVYEGDVIYIQSTQEHSLESLREVLAGERKMDSGKIWFDEREVEHYDARKAAERGVYVISFKREFVENMSIAENLMPVKPIWHIYRAKKVRREIRAYFAKEHVELEPAMKVWQLTEAEQKKLGILKAQLGGARLVLLDLTAERIEGRMAEELAQMIQRMNRRGMTFLILSSNYTVIAESATRTQFLHQGRDAKESGSITDAVRERFVEGVPRSCWQKKSGEEQRLFTGLFDYEWELSDNIWAYLHRVRESSPEIWERYIAVDIPETGAGFTGSTAVIPGGSGDMLLANLSIGENLTIAIPGRTAYGGVISRRLQKRLTESFYNEIHLDPSVHHIEELSKVQKKILSVARFGLAKPEAILLDSPYSGLNAQELRAYLVSLVKKGIRILYFSKIWETMQRDCRVILRTQNGESAKINTL